MPHSSKTNLLPFVEARRVVEQCAAKLTATEPELTGLLDAMGLALAEDLRADRDFPPFPRSTRDGDAVRAADLQSVPVELRYKGILKAGADTAELKVGLGEAVEIMTGAAVPPGADAVV